MALTDHRVPTALKQEYGFDLVIAVPRSAHNSMCSAETHGQQCSATDMLTQEQFDDGVAAFAAANMSLVLYTSIMHVGHSPSWENGTVSKNHPEWSERDELGRCTADYGQCNLSPAGGGVAYVCLRPLKRLVAASPIHVLWKYVSDEAFFTFCHITDTRANALDRTFTFMPCDC